jgi:hypothetical protein
MAKKNEATNEELAVVQTEMTTDNMITVLAEQGKLGELGEFDIVKLDPEEKEELMADLGISSSYTRLDMPRIKIPSGGGTAWEIPGGDPVKELECLVLGAAKARVFYIDTNATGTPPDCQSNDMETGFGMISEGNTINRSRRCETCPNNRWGSDPKGGKGKACSERMLLAVQLKDALVPFCLSLPPTSVKIMSDFIKSVVNKNRKPITNFVVKLGLQKMTSGTNSFAVIAPTVKGVLPEEVKPIMKAMRAQAEAMLKTMPVSDSEIAVGEDDAENEVESF